MMLGMHGGGSVAVQGLLVGYGVVKVGSCEGHGRAKGVCEGYGCAEGVCARRAGVQGVLMGHRAAKGIHA